MLSPRISKKKRPKNVKVVGAGEEPRNIDFSKSTQSELLKAYSYYNYVFSQREAREYHTKLYPKIDWPSVPLNMQYTTFAWIDKMIEGGCTFDQELISRKEQYIQELETSFPKVRTRAKPEETRGIVYQEKKYIADFDDLEDQVFSGLDTKKGVQAFRTILVGLPRYAISELRESISPKLEELQSKDRACKEVWSHLTTKEKRTFIGFYESCLEQIDSITIAKKVVRKRKPKPVPVEKKLKHLKYKKAEPSLGLVSIDPEKMLGAKIIWTFNTKYRELTRFESKEGFDLKGTTLQEVSSSRRKRIRKPEDFKTFFSKTKATMDREFEKIKTKEAVHTGRINQETLILRTF